MRKPRKMAWALWIAVRVGEAAWKLAMDHRASLDARLPAGLIDGLGADVASLRGASAGAKAARAVKRSATLSQDEAARIGHDLAVAVRTTVRRAEPDDAAFRKAFGVGVRIEPKKVSSIEAALRTILEAAQADPEGTRATGILPEDIDEVRRVSEALSTADSTQGAKSVSSKVATKDRDEAQRRVQKAVWRIVGTTELAFRGEPQVAKLFADLIPSHLAAKEEPTTTPA